MTHSTLTTMLKNHVGRLLTGGVFATALMACASGPTKELADARTAYNQAEDSPAAANNPRALERARYALERAETAHDEDPGSVREKRLAEQAEYRAHLVANHDDASWRARHDRAWREEHPVAAERADAAARDDVRPVETKPVTPMKASKAQDKKAAAALQNLGQVANVKEEPRGVVITLSGQVLFPSGERELTPVARHSLDQVAHALQQQPSTTTFQVEGYTDNSGTPKQNEELAQERAKAVADHLVQAGIDPSRIRVVSHGEQSPVANNDTPEGRASNRRVEIVVEQEG